MRRLKRESKSSFRRRASAASRKLVRLLETQEEQDRWLLENRDAINVNVRRGLDQLDRGEGIPEDQLDPYLAKLKTSLNHRTRI
jgi:hypothetical protein